MIQSFFNQNVLKQNSYLQSSYKDPWPWAWRGRLPIALGIVLLASIALQAAKPREIPLENSRVFGLFLVRVEVNGKPAILVVDTGTNVTVISEELIDGAASTAAHDSTSTLEGSGFSGRGVFQRASIKVGPITWRDHRVVVMDTRKLSKSLGQRVDGLLGVDFFGEFGMMMVDLRNHKLILDP
jgi:predicted aspartyl protease